MQDEMDLFEDDELLLEAFKKIMKFLILEVIDEIEFDLSYTLEEMVPDFWKLLNVFECRIAGKAVAILVRYGKLPLVYDGKTSSNHRRYLRR